MRAPAVPGTPGLSHTYAGEIGRIHSMGGRGETTLHTLLTRQVDLDASRVRRLVQAELDVVEGRRSSVACCCVRAEWPCEAAGCAGQKTLQGSGVPFSRPALVKSHQRPTSGSSPRGAGPDRQLAGCAHPSAIPRKRAEGPALPGDTGATGPTATGVLAPAGRSLFEAGESHAGASTAALATLPASGSLGGVLGARPLASTSSSVPDSAGGVGAASSGGRIGARHPPAPLGGGAPSRTAPIYADAISGSFPNRPNAGIQGVGELPTHDPGAPRGVISTSSSGVPRLENARGDASNARSPATGGGDLTDA